MIKANHLLTLRSLHGYSQEKVAELINVSRQAYGKWEKGETLPDLEHCMQLARLYQVRLDDLFADDEQNPSLQHSLPPKGKYIFGTVTLSDRGTIRIPKECRQIFDLQPHDRLILLGDEEQGLALIKEKQFLENISTAISLASKQSDPKESDDHDPK